TPPASAVPYRAGHALPRATWRRRHWARFLARGDRVRAAPFHGERANGDLHPRYRGPDAAACAWSVRSRIYGLGHPLLVARHARLGEDHRVGAGAWRRTLLC